MNYMAASPSEAERDCAMKVNSANLAVIHAGLDAYNRAVQTFGSREFTDETLVERLFRDVGFP